MGEAWDFFRRTPREISLILSSHRARSYAQESRLIALSRLTALALHAPDHLPPPPAAPFAGDMTADEMKQRLLAWRGKDNAS